jgi:molybdopterin-guanine dinucleotide biosynthesis protein A
VGLTALRATDAPVILVACDMPFLTADAFRWLAGFNVLPGAHGMITRGSAGLEPLFATYAPGIMPLVHASMDARCYALRDLVAMGRFTEVIAPAWLEPQLQDINTKEDLARVAR